MSDKDLIWRVDAKSHPFANGIYDRINANRHFILGHESYKEWLDTVPAVELPMSAVEFLNEYERMCKVNCGSTIFKCSTECPIFAKVKGYLLKCMPWVVHHPEEAVAIVEKWAREHPEERSEE